MKIIIQVSLLIMLFLNCSDISENRWVNPSDLEKKDTELIHKKDTIIDDWTACEIIVLPENTTYDIACQKAKKIQKNCRDLWQNENNRNEISTAFENMMMDLIIPYWYGTEWDFNGHTSEPGKGQIACGYFVSTTLHHAGLNIGRYKLAQQTPENEALTLNLNEPPLFISGDDNTGNIAEIKNSISAGLYFVGLGRSHVGFLLKRKNELFFIHSSYVYPGKVTIEKAENSPVFTAYNSYYIVGISNNMKLMERWVKGEKIIVITN